MTTNCIVPPKNSYKERIYTTGAAGYPGCKHISGEVGEKKDFSAIITHAKQCSAPTEIETGEIVGGFAHAQVLALADQVVQAVKSGAIRKFVVMAGCDGRAESRDYYTEFAKALPHDTVILTAECSIQIQRIKSTAILVEFPVYWMSANAMILILWQSLL